MSNFMARSALGSTFGGAVSPNGLTEGVSCVIRNCAKFSNGHTHLRNRAVG